MTALACIVSPLEVAIIIAEPRAAVDKPPSPGYNPEDLTEGVVHVVPAANPGSCDPPPPDKPALRPGHSRRNPEAFGGVHPQRRVLGIGHVSRRRGADPDERPRRLLPAALPRAR